MEYVAALKQLTGHCDYGDNLKDVMCSVNHEAIQQKLMAAKLTFANPIELAQRIEIAEKDANGAIATGNVSPLNKDTFTSSVQDVHNAHTSRWKNTKR